MIYTYFPEPKPPKVKVKKPASPPPRSPITLPSPLSENEAKNYYYGLGHPPPILVARTSTTPWQEPTGPEEDWPTKELGLASSHPIREVWERDLRPKIIDILDSVNVQWTCIDVVRIGDSEEYFKPIIVWIGVRPGTLSGYDGLDAALRCKNLLVEHNFDDIDVEIREAVIRYWGSMSARGAEGH